MFKSALANYNVKYDNPGFKEDQLIDERNLRNARTARDSIRKLIRDKSNTNGILREQDCTQKINNETEVQRINTENQPKLLPATEVLALNEDLSIVDDEDKARDNNTIEEKLKNVKQSINNQAGATHAAVVNDELGVVKGSRQYKEI